MENITVNEILKAVDGKLISGKTDTLIRNISIDSRVMKGDDIFVPLIGERADGHDFIYKAIENGAVAAFTSRNHIPIRGIALIKVDDTLKALQKLGVYYKSLHSIPVVSVTGSVGKTTTREMTAQALSAGFKVFKTAKNYNSNIGLPVTLSEIRNDDEIAVLELGISDFGEMAELTSMAGPDAAIVTNIGVAHIAQLKTRENICFEKLSVVKGLSPEGTLILNGDDDMLAKHGRDAFPKVIYYGLGSHNDVRAENIVYENGRSIFDARIGGMTIKVSLPVMGQHMVMNALAALTAALCFGVDLERAAEKLSEFGGFKNRQQIYDLNGITIVDDTYNASPDSMRAAISVLESIPVKGRRIAVLADMLELGENSPVYHREIGSFAAKHNIDKLITIGSMGRRIADGFDLTCSEDGIEADLSSFSVNEDAYDYLKQTVRQSDAVLFKGSNGMHLGEIIGWLREGR